MFGKLLSDVVGTVTDTAKVALAPVAVAAAVAREVTKPIAEAVEKVVEVVRGDEPKR